MGVPRFLYGLFRQAPSTRLLLRSLALGSKGGDRTVTSADGTPLSVRCTGEGPPIVCVHGAVDGIGGFALLELELAERHAVWVYDRRGRGGSGDAPSAYAFEREVEDLQAIIAATGETPHVVGHSFGAVVALRAAVDGTPMRSLVLYEPPLHADQISTATLDQIRAAIDRDDLAAALRLMATGLAGAAPQEVDVALSVPPVRTQLFDGVRSVPREVDALRSLIWPEDRLPLTGVPTLVLRGERTTVAAYPSVEQVPRWVADAQDETLPGQDHLAATFGPHDLATRILRFVDGH